MNNNFFNPYIKNIDNKYNNINKNILLSDINIYIKSFKKNKPLPEKEQKEKLELYFKNKNKKLRNEIVESNLRLVINISIKYINNNIDILDIIQEGNKGLIRAVEKYDPKYNVKFSTYAVWWIKQGITRLINNNKNNIKISSNVIEKLFKLKKIYEDFNGKYNRYPNINELYNITNIDKNKLNYYLNLLENLNFEIEINDNIEDKNCIDIIRNIFNNEIKNIIFNILNDLIKKNKISNKEFEIFKCRTGIDNKEYKTLDEVGELYNLSRERIRQIEQKIIILLKNNEDLKKINEI